MQRLLRPTVTLCCATSTAVRVNCLLATLKKAGSSQAVPSAWYGGLSTSPQ